MVKKTKKKETKSKSAEQEISDALRGEATTRDQYNGEEFKEYGGEKKENK